MQSSLQFQKDTQQTLLANQQSLHANAQSITKLEVQFGQLATALNEREKGKFSGQPVANLKGQYEIGSNSNQGQYQEQAKSITTLRSGKQIDNRVEMPRDESNSKAKDQDKAERHTNASKVQKLSDSPRVADVPPYVPKAPFPQHLAPMKKRNNFDEILDVFKKVQVNIPLLDAIKQVPAYAKFFKDLCTQKRKQNVHKKVFLA